MVRSSKKEEMIEKLQTVMADEIKSGSEHMAGETEELIWNAVSAFQQEKFYTAKGLQFTYEVKGNEMFVDRKDKSITRATVCVAVETAMALRRTGIAISGPKNLGTFGASYLYPVFLKLGII